MTRTTALLACLFLGACYARGEADSAQSSEPQALRAPGPSQCAVILCQPGYVCKETCDGARCVPVNPPPRDAGPVAECQVDSDCRLFSDYCEGCNCVALGPNEPDPKCDGNLVQCFVDPCFNVVARCEYGSCVASSSSEAL